MTCPRTRAMNAGRQGSILGSGRLSGDSLCKVTGRKAAVSGSRGSPEAIISASFL